MEGILRDWIFCLTRFKNASCSCLKLMDGLSDGLEYLEKIYRTLKRCVIQKTVYHF